jgi:hypothetical protein
VIGEEASLDGASCPELAVNKRFAFGDVAAHRGDRDFVVAAGRMGEPRGPADAEGPALPDRPADRRDEAILRPAQRAPHKMAVFMFVARPGAQQGREVIRAGTTGWNSVASGFTTRAAPPPSAWTVSEAQTMLGHGSVKTTRMPAQGHRRGEAGRRWRARGADMAEIRIRPRARSCYRAFICEGFRLIFCRPRLP